MRLNAIFIFIFVSIFLGCQCVPKQCTKENPFHMIDGHCGNFHDACISKDDACKLLLNKCAQCPPSNFTASALINVLMILRDKISKDDIEHKELQNQLNSTRNFLHQNISKYQREMKSEKRDSDRNFYILLFSVIILIVAMAIEMKCKCFERPSLKNMIASLTKEFGDLKYQINGPIDVGSSASVTVSVKLAKCPDPIKIQISSLDTVLKIKHKIVHRWIEAKYKYVKTMVLELKGTVLKSNELLVNRIRSAEDILCCNIDDKIDPNQFVIVQLRGSMELPELIEINKNESIQHLKLIISELTNLDLNEFRLFQNSDAMEDLRILRDYDWVDVIERKTRNLKYCNMFQKEKKEIEHISCTNLDSIETLQAEICKNLKISVEDLILFFESTILQDKDCIFQTDITDGSIIEYCLLINTDKVKFETKFLKEGDHADIYEGILPVYQHNTIYKKYNKSEKNYKIFLNEIRTYQILKSHERFVKILSVFHDKDNVYIAMEKMEKSLDWYIERINLPDDGTLVKWAKQILEALQELKNNDIIHGNIKPSNILVDKDMNLKISSFGSVKYIDKESLQSIHVKCPYMAPEAFNSDNFDTQVDVWSFGATMTAISTGNEPCEDFADWKALKNLRNSKRKGYELIDSPELLKSFIIDCLKHDPKDRATVEKLLRHGFVTNA